MKKSLIALAALASVAGVAQAQSVEMYGLLDTGYFMYESTGAGQKQKMNAVGNLNSANGSGYFNGSRFGMRGNEDLGGGTKASFVIEYGVNFGTSASGAAAAGGAGTGVSNDQALANMRQGYLQLESKELGQLRIGSQYALIDPTSDALASKQADFGGTNAGQGAHSLLKFNEAAFARAPAAIGYATPTFGGVTARVLYNPSGSVGTDGTAKQESNLQFAVDYKGGPITAGYASSNYANYKPGVANAAAVAPDATHNYSAAVLGGNNLVNVLGTVNDVWFNHFAGVATSLKYSVAGAQYDFGAVQVGLTNTAYDLKRADGAGSLKHNANGAAVGYQLTSKVRLGVAYTDGKIDDYGVRAFNTKGYDAFAFYDLSKRTNAYIVYGKTSYNNTGNDTAAVQSNAAGTAATATQATASVSQSAIGVGIRHTF